MTDDSQLHVRTSVDVERVRSWATQYIWGTSGFPYSVAPYASVSVRSPVANLPNLRSVTALRIKVEGNETVAYHFVPDSSTNRLVLFHGGHEAALDDQNFEPKKIRGLHQTLKTLLARRYAVIAFNMPGWQTPNPELGFPGGAVDHPEPQMSLSGGGSPLRLFLEPVAAALNSVISRYKTFAMTGLSGGGWTTTLYAAVDTRITLSVPVAGSVPLYMRVGGYSQDWEQTVPDFYSQVGYPDLYALGAHGIGRRQIQVLNLMDDCCFGRDQHRLPKPFDACLRTYESQVQQVVSPGGGSFMVYLDDEPDHHMISNKSINQVLMPSLDSLT